MDFEVNISKNRGTFVFEVIITVSFESRVALR